MHAEMSKHDQTSLLLQITCVFVLQGFKYFQPWLRGKEELLLTVVNEDLVRFCRIHTVGLQPWIHYRVSLKDTFTNHIEPK